MNPLVETAKENNNHHVKIRLRGRVSRAVIALKNYADIKCK